MNDFCVFCYCGQLQLARVPHFSFLGTQGDLCPPNIFLQEARQWWSIQTLSKLLPILETAILVNCCGPPYRKSRFRACAVERFRSDYCTCAFPNFFRNQFLSDNFLLKKEREIAALEPLTLSIDLTIDWQAWSLSHHGYLDQGWQDFLHGGQKSIF